MAFVILGKSDIYSVNNDDYVWRPTEGVGTYSVIKLIICG